ncbi:MAG: DUF3168 domain-containing protein [Devosia sp.]|uniref:DUF3168 domain-containing protein n=1 Tax=Devosia sp. 66-22 TaxID=1895753 RepID=UPI000A9D9033|nr:DUF3168 domain-containing protein [Devosia sp. 66-22]MBN9347566.1 DUF3168 domain-containing protein [Devosia sp.]
MTDQAYQVQKAVHALLIGTGALTDLVPAESIADFGGVPTVFPSIIVGEAQIVDEGQQIDRSVMRVYLTLHLWTKEAALNAVKKIGGAVRTAMHGQRPPLGGGFQLGDLGIESVRYVRDPSGENGHGVVTINALVSET